MATPGGMMSGRKCGVCGLDPADGLASITRGDVETFYCHGDLTVGVSCYEGAQRAASDDAGGWGLGWIHRATSSMPTVNRAHVRGREDGMSVRHDPVVGATYVTLAAGEIARTVSLSDCVMVDLDANGKPLGVEVL